MTLSIKLDQIIRRRFRHTMKLDGATIRIRPKLVIIEHEDAIMANMLAAEIPNLLKDGMYEGCFTGCRAKGPSD